MAKKIDLSSIFTDERNLTVLTLIKELIDTVEKVDIGEPLYRHNLQFSLGTLSFITTDKEPYNAKYTEARGWTVGLVPLTDILTKAISKSLHLSDGWYDVLTVKESSEVLVVTYLETSIDIVNEPLNEGDELTVADIVSEKLF